MHRDWVANYFVAGFFFFFFFFFLRFRDFQQVSVRLAHHILAHYPRAHGQFFSDVVAARCCAYTLSISVTHRKMSGASCRSLIVLARSASCVT